jgi:hypothetical protein
MTTTELKKMIIENFIVFACHTEDERAEYTNKLNDYMIAEDEGDYNELLDALSITEDKLGIHTNCQNCGSSTNI